MLTKEASSPILGNAVAGCRRDDCVVGVVVCGEYSAAPSPANAAAQIWHATDASFDLVVMVYEEVGIVSSYVLMVPVKELFVA
jgi:hypothetical protein